MIRDEIKNLIQKAIKILYKEEVEVRLERPTEAIYGNYSTNVAMALKKNPQEIADSIKSDVLEKIEVKNGFINFFVSKEYLQKQVGGILKQKEKFGDSKIGKGKKINVEFCSANPTGPLHLGHGRGAFWGDVLSNVFNKAGYKTTREYFINNYGKQISLLGQSIDARYKEALGQKVEISEDFYLGDYIKEIAGDIIKKDGNKYLDLPETKRVEILKQKGLEKMLNSAKELLSKVGVRYDVWFSEKVLYEKGLVKKAIGLLEKKGFTYKSEDALWFATTKFGDDKDRVLIKANGEPTYLASDIAYHINKVSRKYDLMIDGWGADHWGYVSRLMAAAKVFGFDKKLKIIIGQFVRLVENGQEVKMSKRGGTFVTLEELIGEVGVDVARFFFLMKSIDTHIDFNLDLAKEQSDKNPVYYVQYAYARICSILRKSEIKNLKSDKLDLLVHQSELGLVKKLIQFPEIVEDVSRDYQIQKLPQYAMELATTFHQFYHDCRVISEDKELTRARLNLVLATKTVLKNVLDLMGVSAPEKM
ncbi:MAG: arginine--tRNA ligase [Candidatus Paceibacterota bacterium]